jgi:hypothetical protein
MVFHPKDAFLYLQQKISNPDRLGSIETGDREGAP